MRVNEATVLVAMPASNRRSNIKDAIAERGHDIVTADDGIRAVDRIRSVDVVLVGDYPEPVASVVLDATTPPGVARPNALLAADDAASDCEPDQRLPRGTCPSAVADAIDRAVERATYTQRVEEFSAVAAEAATSDHGSHALADRVAGLAADARRVQAKFTPTDWAATFRALGRPEPTGADDPHTGNRTS
jgi:CheY-like chemotaxis protein